MARKENQALIDAIDAAFDRMSIEMPNWRTDLYEEYYGAQALNTVLSSSEQALLDQLQADNVTIRAVMTPDNTPYSSYTDGQAQGIVPDLFRATAEKLGLGYEIIQPADREEYHALLESGDIDTWMDMDGHYGDEGNIKYKLTEPYLTTSASLLRSSDAYSKVEKIAMLDDLSTFRSMLSQNWPGSEVVFAADTDECVELISRGEVDGALLLTYTAQMLSHNDVQNRLQTYIVPRTTISLRMGVNSSVNRDFYGIWDKTLAVVADEQRDGIVQGYMDESIEPTVVSTLFDHPMVLVLLICAVLLIIFLSLLALYASRNSKQQEAISKQLAVALARAEEATVAKQNFFSKMSHDIRTPLNVVLGMAQVAQKYKNDPPRLEKALNNIMSEGNYLLMLISSILDVNQLEHGHVELLNEPFEMVDTMKHSERVLQPLAEKKEQHLTFDIPQEAHFVVGDRGRYCQIIINIVSNAVKYTCVGGTIHVSLECLPDNVYRFVCTDNGIGMTPEFVSHITEEYTRAEDSRISKVHGTGLGMTVVKGFTDLMHGTLHISSAPGQGSTFTIDIPFSPANSEQIEQLRLAAANQDNGSEAYNGKLVLLAEDNDM